MWELDCEESWALKNWCFWTVVLEKALESPLDCKEIQPVHPKGDHWKIMGVHWKDWCWSQNSSTSATSRKELTHWKGPWCWKGLGAGGEGDDKGWDGWMASPTQWTWVWVNSRSLWWAGRPGVLWFMGLQRVGHELSDWTELSWTEYFYCLHSFSFSRMSYIWSPSVYIAFSDWLLSLSNMHLLSLHIFSVTSLVAQMVKNLLVMQETRLWSLGQEDPLEKRMATHSSILAWRIPWREEACGLQSMGSQRVTHN